MLQSSKKYAKVVSKIYFLQKCIEGKIIPRTLLITNRPGSENVPPEWTAATEACCLELLRVALELEEARKVVIGNELKDTCKQLVCLAGDNMILIEQLSSRLASKTVQFEAEQMVLKDEKLKKLKNPTKKQNKTTEKVQKKRKWIPKTK